MTMMTIESAFNLIWRVRKPRPFAQRVLAYWALITLGPLLFGVSLSLSSYLFTQSLAFTGAAPSTSIIEWLLALASLPLTVLAFTLLYVYLPNCTVAWRDAVIGGLFAAVAFELAKRGFGYYVRRIPTYTAVYGAFAALPVFLLWVYLSWFIALLGAMVASALPAIRVGQFHRIHYPGSDLLDALELLARLAEARAAGRPGCTAPRLATMLRCDMETAQRLLLTMEEREWIARLEAATRRRATSCWRTRSSDARAAVRRAGDRPDRADLSAAAAPAATSKARRCSTCCRTIASTCRSRR
jgi:membrane protein